MAPAELSWRRTQRPDGPADLQPRLAYVHPGQVFVSAEPAEATTVLGSCVSVCLWDARLRLGGVNHFLLADCGKGESSPRFGRPAVERLISELVKLGGREADLSAKVFGGAAVIEALRSGEDHLGARNVEVARSVLAERRIPVVAEDVLGRRGRKLIFHTRSGVALVRLI